MVGHLGLFVMIFTSYVTFGKMVGSGVVDNTQQFIIWTTFQFVSLEFDNLALFFLIK